jgi:7-cyano-7-deazaguanine synthase
LAQNLVLLSGGLDSALNFLIALEEGGVGAAITADYGQKAASREIEKAGGLCRLHDVKHIVLDLTWLAAFSRDALTAAGRPLPRLTPEQLSDEELTKETMRQVWVPNRNGLLANAAAAIAETMDLPWVVMGLNAEEASTFPDNSAGFLHEINCSLGYSTLSNVKVKSFTIDWHKEAIFEEALARGLEFELIWSCYEGGELMCGRCESCARLLRVARQAGETVRLQGFFAEQ